MSGLKISMRGAVDWSANDFVLAADEIGLEAILVKDDGSLFFETDPETGQAVARYKSGDGQTSWNALPYADRLMIITDSPESAEGLEGLKSQLEKLQTLAETANKSAASAVETTKAIAEETARPHAGRHAADGADPITPLSIGAVSVDQGAGFNIRKVLRASGRYTAESGGWLKLRLFGGGGGGGASSGSGGDQGGPTIVVLPAGAKYFDASGVLQTVTAPLSFSADGGSGGAGGRNEAGGGGGGCGEELELYVYLEEGQELNITIGAGGAGGQRGATVSNGKGLYGGRAATVATGGGAAPGAESGGPVAYSIGNGGAGAINNSGFGNGGGGGGGGGTHAAVGGQAGPGATPGGDNGGHGGKGGPGALVLEFSKTIIEAEEA